MSVMKSQRVFNVLRQVYLSEKMSQQLGDCSVLGFKVRTDATKPEIKQAVEEMFSVNVKKVRTVNCSPRKVRFGRTLGTKKAWKKAYVTLAAGQQIDQLGEV